MKLLTMILLQLTALKGELVQQLIDFQSKDGIKNGIVAVSIKNVQTKEDLVAFNQDIAVNSASTLKLVTTAMALLSKSPDYQYKTELAYNGYLEQNTLKGDLILIPSGDPSLGSPRINSEFSQIIYECILALKSRGIENIEGRFKILNQDIENYLPDTWIWGDIGNYYGAFAQPFNIRENYFTVAFKAGNSIGDATEINSLYPSHPDYQIINEVKTAAAGTGDQVYIYSNPMSNKIYMKGTIPLGQKDFPVKGTIPNPMETFSYYLQEEMRNKGIKILSDAENMVNDTVNIDELKMLKTFYSPPLSELIKDCNFQSINLYADAFLNLLPGKNIIDRTKSLKTFWQNKGLAMDGFQVKDGSGLSPSGVMTAHSMTDVLSYMSSQPYFNDFSASIATLGREGTVRYKDRSNKTKGRLKAKSGSIEATRAYAGYTTDKTNTLYAYMIVVNHYDTEVTGMVREFLDNFLIQIGSQ